MKYIIAFIGKAGAGKDTIAQALSELHPDWNMIVSCTTRDPREGEIHGVNYFYLTNEEFVEKVLNGDMLEATYFNGWHYGTMASSLKEGVNIGVFNPEGYDCLCQISACADIKVLGFYIYASDKTRLLRQLNREENPDVHEIIRRFSADEDDFYDIEQDYESLVTIWNDGNSDIQYVVNEIYQRILHAVSPVGESE